MSTKIFIFTIIAAPLGILGLLALTKKEVPEPMAHVNNAGAVHELTTYKSATCGCCGNWVNYMENKGYKVNVVNTEDMNAVKKEFNIPSDLESCHTTIVNNSQYFIEGHIPEEAIAELLTEEPAIAGIGMPGMPSASPGMPGSKTAPFDISRVTNDGAIGRFMTI